MSDLDRRPDECDRCHALRAIALLRRQLEQVTGRSVCHCGVPIERTDDHGWVHLASTAHRARPAGPHREQPPIA